MTPQQRQKLVRLLSYFSEEKVAQRRKKLEREERKLRKRLAELGDSERRWAESTVKMRLENLPYWHEYKDSSRAFDLVMAFRELPEAEIADVQRKLHEVFEWPAKKSNASKIAAIIKEFVESEEGHG